MYHKIAFRKHLGGLLPFLKYFFIAYYSICAQIFITNVLLFTLGALLYRALIIKMRFEHETENYIGLRLDSVSPTYSFSQSTHGV